MPSSYKEKTCLAMCSNGQRNSYSKIREEGLHIACIYADTSEFTLFLCLEQYAIDLVAIVYVNSFLKKIHGVAKSK